MDDTYDQGVIAFAPIISVMAAIALHAIPAARARVARSDVGKLEQAFERAFQSIDVRARLVVAEIGNGPLEDRSEIRFGANRKDDPRADIWLEAR